MKTIKRILALSLAALLVMGLFAGCESEADKIAVLAGTWTMVGQDSEEEAKELLENIDLYEEEIAMADLTTLTYKQNVVFTAEKTYHFVYDVEGTIACVREFFVETFAALYEGRATLNEVYGQEFDQMTEAEFQQFYADLYSAENFETLMDQMAEGAYNYEKMAEPWETGTYSIKGDDIMCTITGETQAEALGYSIDNEELTLTYSDAVVVYTRAK